MTTLIILYKVFGFEVKPYASQSAAESVARSKCKHGVRDGIASVAVYNDKGILIFHAAAMDDVK